MPIIHRVDKRLSGWLASFLSWGGRLTLINAVLALIPSYFMGCFLWPKQSLDKLEQILRGFLWQGKNRAMGGHCLIAWDFVTLPRHNGGLGVRDLAAHNRAMVCKVLAQILQHSYVPCYQWFASKYCQKALSTSMQSGDTAMWRCLKSSMQLVQQSTGCELGDGTRISFWCDLWLGCGRLMFSFPTLYTFSTSRFCTVASQYINGHWMIHLHPNLSFYGLTRVGNPQRAAAQRLARG